MAGSIQTGDGDLFRNADKYHRLPALPYAHGEHRGISSESSHRDDSSVVMRSGRCDDIRSAAGLLHPETTEDERANGRRKAPARVLWFLQSVGRSSHSASVAGVGGLLSFLAGWRDRGFALETTVLPRRRSILVLPRHLAAERCAFDRNKRLCDEGRAGRSSGC